MLLNLAAFKHLHFINYYVKLSNENYAEIKLKTKDKEMRAQVSEVQSSLDKIQSAKAYRIWQRYNVLKKKFKTYIAFNKNEFTLWSPIICKKCGAKDIQPILLRRRVKDFKALKHPFFSGRFLFNAAIMDDVESEAITKEQAAKYLQTSVKYIEWAIENRYKIVEIDNVPKEEVDEFIDDKPYLGNL